MFRALMTLAALVALGGCATSTSNVSKVVITDSAPIVASCANLGTIDGATTLGQVLIRDKARDAALAQLKTRGAEMGATHVKTSVADPKWPGRDTTGVAYRC